MEGRNSVFLSGMVTLWIACSCLARSEGADNGTRILAPDTDLNALVSTIQRASSEVGYIPSDKVSQIKDDFEARLDAVLARIKTAPEFNGRQRLQVRKEFALDRIKEFLHQEQSASAWEALVVPFLGGNYPGLMAVELASVRAGLQDYLCVVRSNDDRELTAHAESQIEKLSRAVEILRAGSSNELELTAAVRQIRLGYEWFMDRAQAPKLCAALRGIFWVPNQVFFVRKQLLDDLVSERPLKSDKSIEVHQPVPAGHLDGKGKMKRASASVVFKSNADRADVAIVANAEVQMDTITTIGRKRGTAQFKGRVMNSTDVIVPIIFNAQGVGTGAAAIVSKIVDTVPTGASFTPFREGLLFKGQIRAAITYRKGTKEAEKLEGKRQPQAEEKIRKELEVQTLERTSGINNYYNESFKQPLERAGLFPQMAFSTRADLLRIEAKFANKFQLPSGTWPTLPIRKESSIVILAEESALLNLNPMFAGRVISEAEFKEKFFGKLFSIPPEYELEDQALASVKLSTRRPFEVRYEAGLMSLGVRLQEFSIGRNNYVGSAGLSAIYRMEKPKNAPIRLVREGEVRVIKGAECAIGDQPLKEIGERFFRPVLQTKQYDIHMEPIGNIGNISVTNVTLSGGWATYELIHKKDK